MDDTMRTEPEPVSTKNIETALACLKAKQDKYDLYQRYYDGNHDLVFATDKFRNAFGKLFRELALNYMPSVVDALSDRLQLTGFSLEGGDVKPVVVLPENFEELMGPDTPAAPGKPGGEASEGKEGTQERTVADDAMDIWKKNRMDERAGQAMREAVLQGNSYIIVWLDAEGYPTLYPNTDDKVHVQYDQETPGKVLWAVKAWWDEVDRKVYVTAYYPDRIEKYVTNRQSIDGFLPTKFSSLAKRAVPGEPWPLANPWGVVPVFRLANNADIRCCGRSEIKDVKPVQDALNKTICDMLVGQEFSALPQRYATGLEVEVDPATGRVIPPFQPGVDRIWAVANSDVQFGQFEAASIEQFLKAAGEFKLDIMRISGTPLTYVMLQTDPPSGEALKALDSRFVKKVKDRHTSFGNTWEDALALAVRMLKGITEPGGLKTRLQADWEPAEQASEKDTAETEVLKQTAGQSKTRSLRNLGMSDDEIVENFREVQLEKKMELSIGQALMANMDGGDPFGTGDTNGGDPAAKEAKPQRNNLMNGVTE